MPSMIQMIKEDCIICDGTGKTTPYPYRKQKKCDHRWSYGSFLERLTSSRRAVVSAQMENERWEKALKSGTLED